MVGMGMGGDGDGMVVMGGGVMGDGGDGGWW